MSNATLTLLLCVHFMCVSLGGPAPPGHFHAIPDSSYRVKGGAYVQDGELIVAFVDFAVVVVDDVTHLLPTAVDNPVVSVKRQLVAENEERGSGQPNIQRRISFKLW